MAHTLHARQRHIGWDRSLPPALRVSPGETVTFEVTEASGGQIGLHSSASDVAAMDFSQVNPVTGPVFLEGAEPGDTLVADLLDLSPTGWGWTANIPGFGLLADEFPEPALKLWTLQGGHAAFSDGITVPLRPFVGTIGTSLAEPGQHSVVPPRRVGGNLDLKEIAAGSRLLLPVEVEGALFSLGDTHAAQGDGEVCGTAIECSALVTVRFGLRKRNQTGPQVLTQGPAESRAAAGGYHITTGIGPDLYAGAKDALRRMLDLLEQEYAMGRSDAYLLCSVAGDLHVSEIVDAPHWVVSFYLPRDLFRG